MAILRLVILLALALTVNSEKFDGMLCNTTCWQTWSAQYIYDSGEKTGCMCGRKLGKEHFFAGSCKMSEISNEINVKVHISYCMTYDEERNITYTGRCPYNNLPFHENGEYDITVDLPQNGSLLNNYMCNSSIDNFICGQQRRRGMLCGECEDGLGPAVMSYTHPCVECKWYGLLLYLTVSFVPATILCFLVILLRINILSPPLNAVVFICQVIVSLVNLSPCTFIFYVHMHHASKFVLPIITLYGLFNMDFFVYIVPPFCISSKMSILAVIALDYVVALYPLTLAAVIYLLIEIHDSGCWLFNCLWKPFHKFLVRFRKSWDIKGSIINAFATLYVLSFTKVISTSTKLMLTTSIRYPCIHKPNYKTQSYYNASCSLFEPCHRPYAYLTLTTMIVFFFLPTLYLFLHPCKLFHRFNFLKLRIMLLPHEIAKVFHQSFKDGIHEGTRDCRWFAGSYLLIRLFITASLVSFRSTQAIQILACVTGTLLVAIFQPHTHTSFNCMDAMLFAALAVCLLLWPGGHNQHIGQVLIFFVPLLVLLVFVGWKLFRKLAIGGRLKWCYYCCCGQLRDGVLSFRELQRLCHGGNGGASAIEQRPLLVKENSPDVPCTVVDIPK